jgi:hypothetical protein
MAKKKKPKARNWHAVNAHFRRSWRQTNKRAEQSKGACRNTGKPLSRGGTMPSMKCPPATQDPQLNAKNRKRTKDKFGYGPENLEADNTRFWEQKAKRWELPVILATLRRCGNCGAFNISDEMVDCGGASYDGEVGYCMGHHFTCSALRTCDTWSPGGPVTDS